MKVLLVAVNAKYIHSNLAVYDLKAYTENIPVEVELAEYTINQQQEEILRDIYEHKSRCSRFFLLYLEYYLCQGISGRIA